MTTPDPAGGEPDRPRDEPVPEPQDRPPGPVGPPPAPDWSTPDTPTSAPRIGGGGNGAPPPYSDAGPPPHSGPAAPYPGAPPPPPPTRNNALALILGLVAALLFCCCAAATVTALTWGRQLYDEMRDRNQRMIGLNEPARDGNLEFVVREVECGIGRIGDSFVNQTAVGQFCLVELTVRNLGNRPAPFSDSLQKAYGPRDTQFRADPGAGILANADQQVFIDDLNPGADVTGTVVYDIPPHTRIVKLELHSTSRSDGVLVRTG